MQDGSFGMFKNERGCWCAELAEGEEDTLERLD